ncbi:unnamed protein product [Hydatigera taeniaeformis]|uniref:Protein kinase domain-containing protein n=1 Tax=Hydatigena taeniaeformis TaxID=6205 RepID=A0A0R3X2M4_HYDTA|nr:unnamed protein product [Hydatigera taeniaeformis]
MSPFRSSIASTSYSQPSSQVGRKYATRSKLGASAPHLVLMPASKLTTSKGKRKGKTPVKRGLGQLSQSPTVRMDSRRRRRIPSSSHSGSNRRKSLHRSVAETPNWKMSQPRWERARMAAAEKTKGRVSRRIFGLIILLTRLDEEFILLKILIAKGFLKSIDFAAYISALVVVAETPIKPSEPGSVMTSPLRRLRRASSLLNFRRGYSSSGGAVSSTSTSRLSIKAEQWQRRLMEEEASLSQFSGGESSLSLSTSSSQFQRRSSNLMANFLSLPSPHSSAKDKPKPPLTSAVSSPPVLNLSILKSGLPRRQPPPVSFEGLFHDLDAPCSTTTSTQPMLIKTPLKSKPTTSATPKRRKAGPRGQVAATEVPISSHVFDEAAMFPGEGEFFQRPVTDPDSSMLHGYVGAFLKILKCRHSSFRKIQSLGGGESHITPRKCAPSPSSTSDADEDNFKPNLPKGVGITILGLRDPLTPIGKTRSVLRCETSALVLKVRSRGQPVMCGGGPFMTPRKQTLCLHSSGCGNNEESRSGAEKEGGYGVSSGLQEPLNPTSQTSGLFQSGPFDDVRFDLTSCSKNSFRWSLSNPSASATKEEGILSFHQVTTRRITPRKGLFRPTSSSSQELSPGAPSTSAAKRGGSLPFHQTATKRTTPRKGLFRSTPSPLRALSSGIPSTSAAKRRGSLPFHQTAAKRTTPCKGPLRPTITTPPPPSQVQANVENQKEERAYSPRRRLRTRRSLFR